MTASGLLKAELYIDGAWVDVSADVMSATWNRGRTSVRQDWMVGGATIVVYDPDRNYDPLNDDGDHVGFLVGGVPVRVSVRQDSGDSWVVMFTGYVDRFVPESWGGDAAASTTIECNGKLFGLAVPLPDFPHDFISERMSNARAGCFYPFNVSNSGSAGTGQIEDFSGRGSHGVGYTDEYAAPTTPGYVQVTPGTITYTTNTAVVTPLPPDIIRGGAEGFFFAASFTLSAGGTQGGSSWNRWALMVEGQPNDKVQFWLEQTKATPSVDADSDQMTLWVGVVDDSVLVVFVGLPVGRRDEWIGKKRTVVAAIDQSYCTIGAASEDGTTINGSLAIVTGQDYDLRGNASNTPPVVQTINRVTRIGLNFENDGSLPGFRGTMDTAAVGFVAGSVTFGAQLVTAANQVGWVPYLFDDRVDKFVDLAGVDSGDWSSTITSTVHHSEYSPVGGRTALEVVREMVTMEHGKLFQEIGGGIVVEDFVAAGERGRTSQATFSDQTGEALRYRDGSAPITAAVEEIVNQVTIRTPTGYQATVTDTASVTAHGLRAVSWTLPFASNAQADAFAALIVARFDQQRPHISEITVDPDSNPDGWWPHLVARDIGDRVTVERQPLGVGSVASVPSIIEGDRWVWTSEFGFAVTYYFSHADTLGGRFYLDSSTLDGPYILG